MKMKMNYEELSYVYEWIVVTEGLIKNQFTGNSMLSFQKLAT